MSYPHEDNQSRSLPEERDEERRGRQLDRNAATTAVGISLVLGLVFGHFWGSSSRDTEVARLQTDIRVMRELEELESEAICEGMRFLDGIGVLDDDTYFTLTQVSQPVPDGLSPLYCSDLAP